MEFAVNAGIVNYSFSVNGAAISKDVTYLLKV